MKILFYIICALSCGFTCAAVSQAFKKSSHYLDLKYLLFSVILMIIAALILIVCPI